MFTPEEGDMIKAAFRKEFETLGVSLNNRKVPLRFQDDFDNCPFDEDFHKKLKKEYNIK